MTTSVARHSHSWLLVLSAGMYACVVPPPLGLDQPDAGANSAPVIESVHGPDGKELSQEAPITVIAQQDATWTITAYDADAGDDLLVQIFVDYKAADPENSRSSCTAAPPTDKSLTRTLTCPVKAICHLADVTTGNPHFVIVEIYDGPVVDTPLMFRSVVPPRQVSQKAYEMNCLAPTQ